MKNWFGGFIFGAWSAVLWPVLPSLWWLLAIGGGAALCIRRCKLLSGILAGCGWLLLSAHWYSHWQLTEQQAYQTHWLTGEVTSLASGASPARFNVKLSHFDNIPLPWWQRVNVRLSWYHPTFTVKQGQYLHLKVKLKPAHGLANQGGFLYQQWLVSQHIQATGYVRYADVMTPPSPSLRQKLLDRLMALPLANTRWLAALTLGYRGLLTKDDWQLTQKSGTSHLIAISGLHLGLVMSAAYFITVLLLKWLPQQRYNLHHLGLLVAWLTAAGFSYLAGFSLPTVRALIMAAVGCLLVYQYRYLPLAKLLLISLFIITLAMPMSLFSGSYWLSFAALTMLVLMFWRWPLKPHRSLSWQAWGIMVRIQLLLSILMVPVVAYQFGFIAWWSPLINLLAVPFITLIILPLALMGLLLLNIHVGMASWPLTLADNLLGYGVNGLRWLIDGYHGVSDVAFLNGVFWLILMALLLVVMLPPLPLRRLAIVVLLCGVLVNVQRPNPGNQWQVNVLDVGQGLSVWIERHHHGILYDTGPAYPSGFNMADAVILPLLRHHRIDRIDTLFISHPDHDHNGSVPMLRKAIAIEHTVPGPITCHAGWHTFWQGLQIAVLWPLLDNESTQLSKNNRSCVMMITDGQHKLLLTGDIEQPVEQRLVERYGGLLQADVMVVPHHGSDSSSSSLLLDTVKPKVAVVSTGYVNRWHFPKPLVIRRYQQRHIQVLNTAYHGQVRITVDDKGLSVATFRDNLHRRWFLR